MEATTEEKQVLRSYSMPAWLAGELQRSARMNERSESAEMRVRLARSFGRNVDGSPMTIVAEPEIISRVGGASMALCKGGAA